MQNDANRYENNFNKTNENKAHEIIDSIKKKESDDLYRRQEDKRNRVEELEEIWDKIYPNADKVYCEVKGIFARSQEARNAVKYINVGDIVNLKPEPTNIYDPFAVKVIFEKKHIGYIPAEDSEEIHNHIINGGKHIAFIEDTFPTFEDKYSQDLWLLVYLDKPEEEDWDDEDYDSNLLDDWKEENEEYDVTNPNYKK